MFDFLKTAFLFVCVTGFVSAAEEVQWVSPGPLEAPGVVADTRYGAGAESPVFEYRSLGDGAMRNGFYEEAARYYEQFLEAARFWPALEEEALESLTDAMLRARRLDSAEKYLTELKSKGRVCSVRTHILNARLSLEKGDAAGTLASVRAFCDSPQLDTSLRLEALTLAIAAGQETSEWAFSSAQCVELVKLAQSGGAELNKWVNFALSRQIYFDIRRGAYANASALLKNLRVSTDQERCERALLEAFYLSNTNRLLKAMEAYREARSLDAFQLSALAAGVGCEIAEHFIGAGRYPEGTALLKDAFDAAGNREVQRRILYRVAEVQEESADSEAAVTVWQRYRRYYPDAPDFAAVSLHTAELLLAQENRPGAFSVMDQLLDQTKLPPETRTDLTRRYARMLTDAEQYDDARMRLKTIFELSDSPFIRGEAMMLTAETFVKQQRFNQALAIYETLTRNTLWHDAALHRKMTVESELNLDKEARESAERILQNCQDTALREDARFFRAHILAKTEAPGAEVALRALLNSAGHKRLPLTMIELGELLLRKGENREAAQMFSSVLERFPNHPDAPRARYQWIYAAFLSGNEAAAVNLAGSFQTVYPRSPYAAEAFFWLSDYYLSNGNFVSAQSALDSILSVSAPENSAASRARLGKADIFRRSGSPDSALSELQKISPQNEELYRMDALFLRGDILSGQGHYAEAAKAYLSVAEASPQPAQGAAAYGRAGDCLMALFSADAEFNDRRLLEARAAYERVLGTSGLPRETEEQTYWKIGHTYHLMQEDQMAMQMFMRPLLRRQQEGNRVASSNIWLTKCGESALRILRKKNTPEASAKAVQLCNLLIKLRLEPVSYWRDTLSVIREGKGAPLPDSMPRSDSSLLKGESKNV